MTTGGALSYVEPISNVVMVFTTHLPTAALAVSGFLPANFDAREYLGIGLFPK